jgi:tetratricopeptide (TPR) repeat protein
LAILEKTVGPEHLNVAIVANNLAENYRLRRNYTEAELLYRRSLTILEKTLGPGHPNVAISLNNLAETYRLLERYAEAEPLYRRSLEILERALGPEHPDVAQGIENFATSLVAQGNYSEAERLYRRVLEMQWGGARAADVLDTFTALLALGHFRDAQFEQAVKKYEEVISQAPLGEDLYVAMSKFFLAAELTAEAEAVMLRALRLFPDSRRVRYELAELYRTSGKMKTALEVFREASQMEGPPDLGSENDRLQLSRIHYRIGGVATDLVQFDVAMESYRRALEVNPESIESRLALADLNLRRHGLQEAVADYNRVISFGPKNAAPHYGLAEANLRLGRLPEALAAAGRALEIDSQHRGARYVRAMALIRMGRRAEGQRELETYRQLESDAQEKANRTREILVFNRGAAAMLMGGRHEQAIGMFRNGTQSHPDAAVLHLNLGIAQSKTGLRRQAAETFEKMLGLGLGDDFVVHRALSQEYEAMGDGQASRRHRAMYLQKIGAALRARLN